jgi:hypothetical protein
MTSDSPTALVFSYDFHAGAETMFSRHFNDPTADSYFTKRKWGKGCAHAHTDTNARTHRYVHACRKPTSEELFNTSSLGSCTCV